MRRRLRFGARRRLEHEGQDLLDGGDQGDLHLIFHVLGHVIEVDDLTPKGLREAVRSVLEEPTWRDNVERVRDESNALPSASDAIPMLERLVADRPNGGLATPG